MDGGILVRNDPRCRSCSTPSRRLSLSVSGTRKPLGSWSCSSSRRAGPSCRLHTTRLAFSVSLLVVGCPTHYAHRLLLLLSGYVAPSCFSTLELLEDHLAGLLLDDCTISMVRGTTEPCTFLPLNDNFLSISSCMYQATTQPCSCSSKNIGFTPTRLIGKDFTAN